MTILLWGMFIILVLAAFAYLMAQVVRVLLVIAHVLVKTALLAVDGLDALREMAYVRKVARLHVRGQW